MPAGIAYRAQLPEGGSIEALADFVRSRVEIRGWLTAEAPPLHLPEAHVRGLDGSSTTRHGLDLEGLWVNPHFGADDLCLVFDRSSGELMDASRALASAAGNGAPTVLGFSVARTTFADAATHAALIGLLEDLAGENLASVEMGDPDGKPLARDPLEAERRIHAARVDAIRGAVRGAEGAIVVGGFLDLLPLAESQRRRQSPPGPLDLLPEAERGALVRAREALVAAWNDAAAGLDQSPDIAVSALERLTDMLLSHPGYRHDTSYLEDTFAWESGVALGFALIEALGGHWERIEGTRGPVLRVANLGGVGVTWKPLASAADRLAKGPLYAPDVVLTWLRGLVAAASEVYLAD